MFGEAIAVMSSLLRKCVPLSAIQPGRAQIHGRIVVHGLLPRTTLEINLLLVYSRCGNLKTARRVFDGMADRNMHSRNILISSFANGSAYNEALSLFTSFLEMGLCPDANTLPALFKACGGTVDIALGRMLHVSPIKLGFEDHVVVASSILDIMLLVKNTSMDPVSVSSILSACGKEGDVTKGKEIHEQVMRHYACMVDLLGRLGRLEEALKLVDEMPVVLQPPPSTVWGALLGAYVVHNNVEIGEISAHRLFELEPRNCRNYKALCSIYETVGRGDGVSGIESKMKELGLIKTPGSSVSVEPGHIRSPAPGLRLWRDRQRDLLFHHGEIGNVGSDRAAHPGQRWVAAFLRHPRLVPAGDERGPLLKNSVDKSQGLVGGECVLGDHVVDEDEEVLVQETGGPGAAVPNLVLEGVAMGEVEEEVFWLPAFLEQFEEREDRASRGPIPPGTRTPWISPAAGGPLPGGVAAERRLRRSGRGGVWRRH
ncbi:hypothetical protein H6P81_007720 [Aristolochia fimbriata]|uniref:Pentatricopeptide repeat-containing protein n=1 Tax=Aristolochia fimbriata TaxID=158543 RepID=A0AAV7F4Q2_ARIFI|nr:hypothetical protein H6P81_007720 [Aristolochia fimbriata]